MARVLLQVLPLLISSVCFELLLSHASRALPLLLHLQLQLLLHLTFCLLFTSIQFCSFTLCLHLHTILPVLQASRKRFGHSLSPPAENWTCSLRRMHMSIVHTPLFKSSLIVVPSRVFRMCGLCSSSTTMFPARTTFCIEMTSRMLCIFEFPHVS